MQIKNATAVHVFLQDTGLNHIGEKNIKLDQATLRLFLARNHIDTLKDFVPRT